MAMTSLTRNIYIYDHDVINTKYNYGHDVIDTKYTDRVITKHIMVKDKSFRVAYYKSPELNIIEIM